ncbi:helix-turn-helix domain-containing protein [Methylobacterium sp. NEAU 140]|uniref:helix-turn-helix domain-containing protein n=1 Tax=Methylobacterium sp. NEAU 140 TaxID=3064945 RepID=UPI002735EE05|nr:helix-turn-helix domain-containing protein [Methylobacterium sp. NEAU 140]MDP4023118.1 helix-turn-helix domain-containing protein [Methylobacterium sp. NEAU 140]
MARISLAELAKRPPRVDHAKLDATTEEDIRRYQIEDGYDPDAALPEIFTVTEPLRAIRRRLGITQAAMAALIGVEPGTLRNWEKGRSAPDPVASRLIAILAREPEAALRVLQVTVPSAA